MRPTSVIATAPTSASVPKQMNPLANRSRRLPQDAEQIRQIEPTESAGRADHTGHDADLERKTLRNHLEDGAVAHAETTHRRKHEQLTDRERRRDRNAYAERCEDDEHHTSERDTADAIGDITADGTQHATEQRRDGNEHADGDFVDVVRGVEKDREIADECEEAAERDRVEKAEPPQIRNPQHGCVIGDRLGFRMCRAIGGHERKDCERREHRQRGETHRRVPTILRREHRRKQRREHGARIPGAGDAHGQALLLRRIPAACKRQRHGKACACDAQQETDGEHLAVGRAGKPADQQRQQRDRHRPHTGDLRAEAIAQEAEYDAEKRAAERRNRHEERFLCDREIEIFRDEERERPEDHPNHERDIEVQERCEERSGRAFQ